ncbi:hypothetical protein ILUMI_03202 [Ignelater luminosus]|uniref:Uncharacterized protein n=1 Tax=Ignelater luminosus TaxID=2038154 RepID=A0A8K0DB82_IGNLU|nr:hypothetical protein ILUMI_03202 [Ignelater luminosus]
MMKELMAKIREMKKGQKEYYEHILKLKQENKNLKKKIDELRNRMEIIEKDKKKNNIVLSGLPVDPKNVVKVKEEMEKFFKEELNTDTKIKDTRRIGDLKYVVKMKTITDKREIMKNKCKLRQVKNKIVYINEELTEKERKIQKIVKETAAEEIKKDNKVRIGHMKLNINGEYWK